MALMSDDRYVDRFDRAFKARIPEQVAHSFTDDQRAAIRTAFGGERWDGHPLDLRGVIPLVRWYFVFIAGPDKRSKKRDPGFSDRAGSNIIGRIFGTVVMLLMLILLALLLFAY